MIYRNINMKWIKTNDSLPLAGKEVLCIYEHHNSRLNKVYRLGYLCCRSGWQIPDVKEGAVIMWTELPAIEPE